MSFHIKIMGHTGMGHKGKVLVKADIALFNIKITIATIIIKQSCIVKFSVACLSMEVTQLIRHKNMGLHNKFKSTEKYK